jgi:hypothetical protein
MDPINHNLINYKRMVTKPVQLAESGFNQCGYNHRFAARNRPKLPLTIKKLEYRCKIGKIIY